MIRTINRALFYKEWINVRWITLLTIIILLYFKVYGVIAALNQNRMYMKHVGKIWTDRSFNNGLYTKDLYIFIMIFVVIVLAVILFLGEKTSETRGFIASMPFTRKEIIFNKWFVGVSCILISFAITYILLSLVYIVSINSFDVALNPYSDIIKWFFIDTFQYICIFTFMLLAQTVMGNSIVSSIIGVIILEVPLYITVIVRYIIIQLTRYQFIYIDKIGNWLNIYGYNLTERLWTDAKQTDGNDVYITYYYNNYGLKLLILLVLTCLFLYLTYIAYSKMNLEYSLRLIVFKHLEPIFIWGVAVCLGASASLILESGHSNSNLILFLISAVVLTLIGYFISKLLIKIFSAK